MQKAIFFLVAVALLAIIVFSKPKEGFTNLMGVNWTSMNEGTPAALYSKLPIKQPKVVDLAEVGIGNVQPSPPAAGTLPSAPAPQRSKETPNPYRDPTLEPAKYIQLLGVKEDLQAFFGFQAFMLEQQNDPAITIPLTRARADMSELINVASVMERNPGLPSRINNKQLDDIRANLAYLRDVLHDLEASGAIQPQALEGFEDPPVGSSPSSSLSAPPIEKRATLEELQEFQVRVVVEITRLEASGTSDPVIQGRLNTLNRIKDDVDQVIAQLQNGTLTPETTPIMASDIEKAFKILGKPSDPLPQILREADLPPAIANLFPGGLSPRDTEQAQQINNIVKGYMNNLFEGASWGVNLMFKYDNPTIAKLNAKVAEAQVQAQAQPQATLGLPGASAEASTQIVGTNPNTNLVAPADLAFDRTTATYDSGIPGLSISRTLPEPNVGKLDWKQRSQQIKEQIRLRGLNPADFGALPDNANVSNEFSWRGYAQMMCMRLNATTDPGLAQTCGCPPQGWKGWRD
jgi:hypothetical protein